MTETDTLLLVQPFQFECTEPIIDDSDLLYILGMSDVPLTDDDEEENEDIPELFFPLEEQEQFIKQKPFVEEDIDLFIQQKPIVLSEEERRLTLDLMSC
ncbi:hypothetical protein RMATCC62417_11980 [Rhizopus microsporus]|nr:hypothetical protein RMATCC62417_11980 [Rhizopus microsporus]